jgi:hypothetical protein
MLEQSVVQLRVYCYVEGEAVVGRGVAGGRVTNVGTIPGVGVILIGTSREIKTGHITTEHWE